MAYLELDDYGTVATQIYLDQILTQASESTSLSKDEIRLDAELTAIAEISAFLTGRYIIEDEFIKVSPDADRNKIVMRCTMNFALYNIHFVINPRDIPELREKAMTACLEKLAAFRDGELIFLTPPASGGIEIRPVEDGGTERLNLQSQIKFVSKPFNDIYENP